jgi:hypothetical protein
MQYLQGVEPTSTIHLQRYVQYIYTCQTIRDRNIKTKKHKKNLSLQHYIFNQKTKNQ